MKYFQSLFAAFFLLLSSTIYAEQFPTNTNYTACFTPPENCTLKITQAIDNAQQSLLMQAYTISSYLIENALIRAKKRGVDVKIIFDKNQHAQFSKPILYLAKQKIPIWVDYNLTGLAHNKVIIIDNKTVITGSFNFTKAAQNDNAENVLIISDNALAAKYTENWQRRLQESRILRKRKF